MLAAGRGNVQPSAADGAAAGSANSVAEFWSVVLPCAAVYVMHFAGTMYVWRAGRAQAAQYMAWSPWLLLATVGIASLAWELTR
jgi:hypothetical protein